MVDTAGITLSLDDRASDRSKGPSTEPQLVVALECSRPSALSARHSLAGVHTIHLGRASSRRAERTEDGVGRKLRIGIPDRWMSSSHARIEHSFGRWVLEDAGSKNGTLVNGELTQRTVLRDGDLIELGHTLLLFRTAVEIEGGEPADIDLSEHRLDQLGLTTLIPSLAQQFDRLRQIAGSGISVLIEGGSGTGKEVLARAAHQLSGRTGELVAVNCGAIPANLVESELFGYRKGAFSGAVEDRPGLIRSADQGTLFLDEIGDLPGSSQAALLRVLQQKEVTPVGGSRPVPVDIRVMAATHRDLDAMVEREEFRRDLFARLAGYRVALPRLVDRRADLGLLIGILLDQLGVGEQHSGFETEAARLLFFYDWPLNIRELEQCLRTATVLAGDSPVDVEHLPEALRNGPASPAAAEAPPALSPEDEERRQELLMVLRQTSGNISATARAMGKDRKQIQRWIKRFQIDPESFRA